MVLDGVRFFSIHLYRVILYVWRSPFVVSLFWSFPGEYVVIFTITFVSGCLQTRVSPFQYSTTNNTFFISFFPRFPGLPFGEGVLTCISNAPPPMVEYCPKTYPLRPASRNSNGESAKT